MDEDPNGSKGEGAALPFDVNAHFESPLQTPLPHPVSPYDGAPHHEQTGEDDDDGDHNNNNNNNDVSFHAAVLYNAASADVTTIARAFVPSLPSPSQPPQAPVSHSEKQNPTTPRASYSSEESAHAQLPTLPPRAPRVAQPQSVKATLPSQDALQAANTIFNQFMSTACMLINCDFEEVETWENAEVPGILKPNSLDAINADPPFHARREMNKPNSEHDVLTAPQMSTLSKMSKRLLKHNALAILSCTAAQHTAWVDVFKARFDRGGSRSDTIDGADNADDGNHDNNGDDDDGDEHNDDDSKQDDNDNDSGSESHAVRTTTKTNSSFAVARKPLHIVWAPGHKHTPHHAYAEFNASVEYAFFARRTRPNKVRTAIPMVQPAGWVPSRLPASGDVLDNVQRLESGETLYVDHPTMLGRKVMLRPEQKPVILELEKADRYFGTDVGGVFFDPFAGTGTTAIMCIQSSVPREFVGAEKYTRCWTAAVNRIRKELAHAVDAGSYAVLNNVDTASAHVRKVVVTLGGKEKIVDAARVLIAEDAAALADGTSTDKNYDDARCNSQSEPSASEASASSQRPTKKQRLNASTWSVPPAFPAHTTLPQATVASQLAMCNTQADQFVALVALPLHKWPRQIRARVLHLPASDRRAHHRAQHGVVEVAAETRVADSGNTGGDTRIVATRAFIPGMKIATLHGHLVCTDLSRRHETTKMYGSENILVSVPRFKKQRLLINLANAVSHTGICLAAYLVPAEDHFASACKVGTPAEANALFCGPDDAIQVDTLQNHNLYSIVATTHIPCFTEIVLPIQN